MDRCTLAAIEPELFKLDNLAAKLGGLAEMTGRVHLILRPEQA